MNDEMTEALDNLAKVAEIEQAARAKCLSMAVTVLEDIATNGGQSHELRAKATGALTAIAIVLTK